MNGEPERNKLHPTNDEGLGSEPGADRAETREERIERLRLLYESGEYSRPSEAVARKIIDDASKES